jgi:hypothetical protein
MRRGLVICLVAAIMLAAGSASAGMYASLRMTGSGNHYMEDPYLIYYPYGGRQDVVMVSRDAGLFAGKELAVGFGDKIQGEISFGFDTVTESWEFDDEERGSTNDFTFTMWNVGVAGFYPIFEGDAWRVDAGLRYKYMSGKYEEAWDSDREDTDTYTMTGWSLAPVVRHLWFLADGAIGIGPEVAIKYSSFKTENEWDISRDDSVDGPEISAIDLEYSLRLDFFFN